MSISPEHQKLEKVLIDLIETKEFEIKCSSSHGPKTCEEVNGVIPDLRAYNSTEELILFGEAETADTLDTEHTKKQIKVLANRVMSKSKKVVPFYLAVPKGSKGNALEIIKEIGYDKKKNIFVVEF